MIFCDVTLTIGCGLVEAIGLAKDKIRGQVARCWFRLSDIVLHEQYVRLFTQNVLRVLLKG